MSQTKQRAAVLLAQGMNESDVAAEIGVAPSYITAIKQDDEYKSIYNQLVARQQSATHSKYVEIDNHYDSLELKLLSTMDENSDVILASLVDKPAAMLAAVRTLNGAKRRGIGENTNNQIGITVALDLPTFIQAASTPQVQHNSNNEVIEVDGKPLVAMSGTAVKKQLQSAIEESHRLPDSSTEEEPLSAIDLAVANLQSENEAASGNLDLTNL